MSDCDVAIVGGGLVGASLASALAPLGYRVAVLEAVPPRAAVQPSYDDRTLALNLASCRILEALGLWRRLSAHATPIRTIIVNELGRPGRVVLDAAEMGLDAFGQVVEARAFGAAVLSHLETLDGVTLHSPARLVGWRADEQHAELEVRADAGDFILRARLVVAADGADSVLRQLAGIAAREKDYGQTAVICNVTPSKPHHNVAWERMTPTGPFAVLPHQGERCGLVWCLPHDQAGTLLEWPEESFLAAASERFGDEIGPFLRVGRRSAYPLRLVVPERDLFSRGVLVGNAAHVIHPAGAQGFNLGLRDVAALAEVLSEPLAGGPVPDPGAGAILEAYGRWRRPDREATVTWADTLAGLFASPLGLSAAARSLGLLAHAWSPTLRRRLAIRAMGYRGRAPRLALGEPLLAPHPDTA